MPGFLYVLILYIVGRFIIPDARATLFDIWFTAAIVAMTEQIKVAKSGINNTAEVLFSWGRSRSFRYCSSLSRPPKY